MQSKILVSFFLICCAVAPQAQNLNFVPVTSLSAEIANNTSAANNFQGQPNGNAAAGNISKLNLHSLLYPGSTTKIYAHFMPWWGDHRHINIGYSSHDPAQIHRQVTDMISRGIDGMIIDWYGPADYSDETAKLVMAEVEQHPGFTFAIMVDKGAIQLSPCPGCSPQQTLISLVNYIEQTYTVSPAYMRIDGRPVITNFDIDLHYKIDWSAVNAAAPTNPDFIFQHKGGFSHPVSGGSYSWVIVNVTDEGMNYLSQFYAAGLSAPDDETIGAAYKGFNDMLASWGTHRVMNQQCGQTFLETFRKINGLYNSGKQLEGLQMVTWNDYEEATELETGIDNCVSISSNLSGSVLSWQINGNENTIDHYAVYVSNDGTNLMPLNNLAAGSRSLNLCDYALAPGTYTAFVQAVGVPMMRNQISSGIRYTAQCSGEVPPTRPATGITLGATPSAIQLVWGQSASSSVTVSGSTNGMISLSCSHLPAGVRCSFSPSSIPAQGKQAQSTLTIFTTSPSGGGESPRGQGKIPYGLLVSSFGLTGMMFAGSINRKKLTKLLLLGILAAAVFGLSSCGASPAAMTFHNSTAAKSYTIAVNGVSAGQQVSTPVTLTLQ